MKRSSECVCSPRGKQLLLVNSEVGDHVVVKTTRLFLDELPVGLGQSDAVVGGVDWGREGDRIILDHPKPVQQVCWHGKGDYFATVTAEGENGGRKTERDVVVLLL